MARRYSILAVALCAVSAAACDLDLQDPNNPTEEDVITNPATIAQTVIGLQAEYSNQLADPLWVPAMVTNELGAKTATFESFRVLHTGSQPATNDFGSSSGPWTGQYRVIRLANVLIANGGNVGFGPGTVSGILALSKLYKAMAIGNLLMIYERIPLDVGPNIRSPEFATRQAGLNEVLRLLNEARTHIQQQAPSAEFNAQMLAPGFNLPNTISAMLARYALIAGDLTTADAAAAAVDPTVFSEFRFAAGDPNPLWNLAVNGGNSTAMRPKDVFRLEAEPGDQRVAYWVVDADTIGWAGTPLDEFNRYSDRLHSIPAYLPDEMKLIRAEVAARENRLGDALIFVNQVRTQCASALPEPVACLPALTIDQVPTQDAMLAEILRQRRYELYLQGVRMEDLRRFGLPVKYQWIPVSGAECGRNVNVPPELCAPQPANPGGAN
jgi:starch-binding outer membrane protein, SusD/RagB family